MAAKKDSTVLLLLLVAGAAFAFAGKAKASTPKQPIEDDDVDDDGPHGIVIPLDDELQRVDVPSTPIPEGTPLSERPIGQPDDDMIDAARAAAAAADASSRPLYPSVPSTAIPRAQPGEAHEPIPVAQAPIDLVPAPASLPSTSAPAPGPNLPAGYDPTTARRAARAIAAHLKRKGRAGYDRRLLEQWQRQAGLEPDRIYGGASRGALLFYGVPSIDAPQPFFKPTETIPFVPPDKR
jgi:hypothetical protein